MAQVTRSPKVYDVCIVGSGAAGGTAAKILTEGGLNVVMIEAGPPLNPEKDYKEHVWPYQLPHRGAGVGGKASDNFGEFLAPNGSWDIAGVDLSERAVVMGFVGSVIGQPVILAGSFDARGIHRLSKR